MTNNVSAWQLEISPDQWIAVSEKSMLEYIGNSSPFPVPSTPKGCNHLLIWHKNFVPVFDMQCWLDLAPANNNTSNLVVLSYNTGEQAAAVALKLYSPPQRITVNDNQFSENLLAVNEKLHQFVCSLFEIAGDAIAVMDISKLVKENHA